jgi:hypothetical protein
LSHLLAWRLFQHNLLDTRRSPSRQRFFRRPDPRAGVFPHRRFIRVPWSEPDRRGVPAGFRNARCGLRRAGTGRRDPSSARCPPTAKRLRSGPRSGQADACCVGLPCAARRRVIAVYRTSRPCLTSCGHRQGSAPPRPAAGTKSSAGWRSAGTRDAGRSARRLRPWRRRSSRKSPVPRAAPAP